MRSDFSLNRGLGQHKNVGEKPTVTLFIQINHPAGTPKYKNYKRHDKLGYSSTICLKKNLNAPRPSEHPPVRGKNVKTFRWDHRLQRRNLFMAFKRVSR